MSPDETDAMIQALVELAEEGRDVSKLPALLAKRQGAGASLGFELALRHGAADFPWKALEGGGKNKWVRRVKGRLEYSVTDPRPRLKTPPPLPAPAAKKGPPPVPAKTAVPAKAARPPARPPAAPAKAPPPAPAAPPAKAAASTAPEAAAKAAIDPALHEEGRAFLKLTAANLRLHPTLGMEQRKEYFRAVEQVMKSMSPAAAARVMENLPKGVEHAADVAEVKAKAVEATSPKHRDAVARSPEIGGFYTKGRLVVDGAYSEATREQFARSEKLRTGTTVGLHAHELAHAIDGPKHEFSKSPEWLAAFEAEIKPGKLTKYAATQPAEGWAEFGRLILAGEHDPSQVKAAFPKCAAVWEKYGLVPPAGKQLSLGEGRPSSGEGEIILPEMFAGRVEMDDEGGHGDLLLEADAIEMGLPWNESKHPRAKGRFAKKAGAGGEKANEALAPAGKPSFEKMQAPEVLSALAGGEDVAPMATLLKDDAGRPRGLAIRYRGDDYTTQLVIQADPSGGLECHYGLIRANSGRGGPMIPRVLGNQLRQLQALGVNRVFTHGGRDDTLDAKGQPNMIGYKVWPKQGFDGDIPASVRMDLPAELRKAETIQQLYALPGGQKAWEEHGRTTPMEIKLDGPQARRVIDLAAKLEARDRRNAERKAKTVTMSYEPEEADDNPYGLTWEEFVKALAEGGGLPEDEEGDSEGEEKQR